MKSFKQYIENKQINSLSYGKKSLANWSEVARDFKKDRLKKEEEDLLKKLDLLKDPQGRFIGFNAHSAKQVMERIKEIRRMLES
jgi:hypothetical protein